MKAKPLAKIVFATALGFGLISCATVRKSTSAATAKISSLAKMPKLPDMAALADSPLGRIMPGSGVKVVEVREKDLKPLPNGHERAIAYQNERKRGFWFFGPVDFKEPTLPEAGSEMDGSLLPPRMP
ncbi:MAG: hypothetical protein Q8Q59_01230 [Luteolibacter sp.]|jgi:hypothetical protein|nr:hypothetical protein [Luteolibacter sp.]